jgi:5'-nucleotidase
VFRFGNLFSPTGEIKSNLVTLSIRYSLLKYAPLLEIANLMNYTAMGLGNHDFDDGVEGLVPFVKDANFAILAANLNATRVPELVSASRTNVMIFLYFRLKIGENWISMN